MFKKICFIIMLQLIFISISCKNKNQTQQSSSAEITNQVEVSLPEKKQSVELWNGFYENMTIKDTAKQLRLLYPNTEYLKENPNNDVYHQHHSEFHSKNFDSWDPELMGNEYDLLQVNNYLPPIDTYVSHYINNNSVKRLVFYFHDIYLYGVRVEYTIDITPMVDDKVIEKYGEPTKRLDLGGLGMKMYYWTGESVDVYYRNFQSYSMNGVLDVFSKSLINNIQKELNHGEIIDAGIGL